jgi:Abortive infection C-terminus
MSTQLSRLELERPEGLEDRAWESIEDCLNRLQRAFRDGDRLLIVGSAKELVEATARVVLDARGQPAASGEDFQEAVNQAHVALKRQPGPELAIDPAVRAIAQGSKTIATQLRELRNDYGTGHGRAFIPDVAEEVMLVGVDAAMLWSRWALRRLQHFIAGMPSMLARELHEGKTIRSGELRDRLVAVDLPSLDPDDQRLLGVAVADRAMRGTFVIKEDGVDACAEAQDASLWPPGYREGLAEGLFLDRKGHVYVEEWGARHTAIVLAAHPDPGAVLCALSEKIRQASWSPRFANSAQTRREVITSMREVEAVLPTYNGRRCWQQIAAHLVSRAEE